MKRIVFALCLVGLFSVNAFAWPCSGGVSVRSVGIRGGGLFSRLRSRQSVVVVERVRRIQQVQFVQQVLAAPVFSVAFAAPAFLPRSAAVAHAAAVPAVADAGFEARLSAMESSLGRLQCIRNCLQ